MTRVLICQNRAKIEDMLIPKLKNNNTSNA